MTRARCASSRCNIHKGLSQFNRRMVIHELREGLRALAPDLVFLQEVQGLQRAPRRALRRLAERAAARVPRRRRTGSTPTAATACTTTATTATPSCRAFRIVSSENEDVSDHRFERRGLLHCVVAVPGWRRNLHCVCVHLSLHERGRRRQLDAIGARLEELGRPRPADRRRGRLQRLAPARDARAGGTPRHDRGVASAYGRPRGAHLPEPAAAAAAGPHLRARLQRACSASVHRGPPWSRSRTTWRSAPSSSRHSAVQLRRRQPPHAAAQRRRVLSRRWSPRSTRARRRGVPRDLHLRRRRDREPGRRRAGARGGARRRGAPADRRLRRARLRAALPRHAARGRRRGAGVPARAGSLDVCAATACAACTASSRAWTAGSRSSAASTSSTTTTRRATPRRATTTRCASRGRSRPRCAPPRRGSGRAWRLIARRHAGALPARAAPRPTPFAAAVSARRW